MSALSVTDRTTWRELLGVHEWDDIKQWKDPPPLVHRWLGRGELAGLVGPFGGGKSFVTLDLALSIATGCPWLGQLRVERGKALYVVAEGRSTIRKRVAAWLAARKIEASELRGRFLVTDSPNLNLGDPGWVDAVRAAVAELSLTFIAIDTLARATPGIDENSSRFGDAVHEAGKWCYLPSQPAVAVVHHTGRDLGRGSRGHTSVPAAFDVQIQITPRSRSTEISSTKQRDRDDPSPLVVTLTGSPPVFKGYEPTVKEIIHAAIEQSGGLPRSGIEQSLRQWIGVSQSEWRRTRNGHTGALIGGGLNGHSTGPARSAIMRGLADLKNDGRVHIVDGRYLSTNQAPWVHFWGTGKP